MGLMDRVKEQAAVLAQKTQEAAHEGRVRLDQAQAKRRADAMFRELGAAIYAERTGRPGSDTADKIERLVKALKEQEAQDGLGETPQHQQAGQPDQGTGQPGQGTGQPGQGTGQPGQGTSMP